MSLGLLQIHLLMRYRGTTDIDPTLSYWTVQNSWGPVSIHAAISTSCLSTSYHQCRMTQRCMFAGRGRRGAKTDISRWCGTLQTNLMSPILLAESVKAWWRDFLICLSICEPGKRRRHVSNPVAHTGIVVLAIQNGAAHAGSRYQEAGVRIRECKTS